MTNYLKLVLLCITMALISFEGAVIADEAGKSKIVSSKFFRHIMFRETPFASYRGIYPVDSKTTPDFAHYKFSYDEQGRVREIQYQINDRIIRGNEVWDSFIWFAPKVKIDYQPNKEVHTYFNSRNEPFTAHGNVFKAVYQLDDKGQRTSLKFYDEKGELSENAWNIHRYEWRFANNKVYEKRFDLKGEQRPLRPEFRFFEVELDYDNDGKLTFLKNLGLEGKPTNNDSGAGIDRIVYDHNGNFTRWQVYDKDGNPVEGNRPMVHVGEHMYDQYGNKVGLRGFDRFGKQIGFSWGVFEHVRAYNEHGNMSEQVMLNDAGEVMGHVFMEYADTNDTFSWLKSKDKSGNLVATPMLGGAAALQFVYSDSGVERKLFNADMTPYTPPTQSETD